MMASQVQASPSAPWYAAQVQKASRGRMQCKAPYAALLDGLFKRQGQNPPAKQALKTLLATIEGTQRGISSSPQQVQQIKKCFHTLWEADQERQKPEDITATWRLLWTTEKETLFILKNAGLFGTQAGEVYQVIDAAAGYLGNVIEFPPDGAFIVDSDIQLSGDRRVDFQFSGAALLMRQRRFGLPPFGKGWFDNVYVDGRYRLSKDVRGDYLVTVRDGPPRQFG